MERPHKRQGGGWQRRMKRKEAENPLLLKPKGMVRPPLVAREIQFHHFREALGEARMTSFLAHVRRERSIRSCANLDKALGEGRNLLELVLTGEKHRGYRFGFRKFARNRWLLVFGYTAPLAGDSGVWTVQFKESGEIAKIRLWRWWIS